MGKINVPPPVGLPVADPEELLRQAKEREERERREREAKIRQERDKLQARLNDAQRAKQEIRNKAAAAATQAGLLADALESALSSLVAATNNSHVGTDQFRRAAASAIGKARAIESTMRSVASGGSALASAQSVAAQVLGLNSSSGGGSGATAGMIHVAPETAHGRYLINQAGTDIFNSSVVLLIYMGMVQNQSQDLKTAADRMQGFSSQLNRLVSQLSKIASDIRSVYDSYHAAQAKAIYTAELIPK